MAALDRAIDWLDAHRDEAVNLLWDLVRIPSVNPWFRDYEPYTTELAVQRFTCYYLSGIGFEARLMDVDAEALARFDGMPGYYPGRPMKDRPNLHAVLRGAGGGRSILLTGHADVVVEGEGWTRDPFGAELAGGRMYGRGTVDMKGGIAAMIMAVRAIREAGRDAQGPM